MGHVVEYDPRHVAGVDFFNQRDFFEAHEVWEDLWHDCGPENRRFHQGLIQAAVALHHWHNGNWRGARRLFHSGRKYMAGYPQRHLGVDIPQFWAQMERALDDVLQEDPPPDNSRLDLSLCPTINLEPPPDALTLELPGEHPGNGPPHE